MGGHDPDPGRGPGHGPALALMSARGASLGGVLALGQAPLKSGVGGPADTVLKPATAIKSYDRKKKYKDISLHFVPLYLKWDWIKMRLNYLILEKMEMWSWR
jgi:hypothetical protein